MEKITSEIQRYLTDSGISVVRTLSLFEEGFSVIKRTPVGDKVSPNSIEEYIECRLNFEVFKIPLLEIYQQMFDGYLFKIHHFDDLNGRRFKRIYFKISDKPDYMSEYDYNDIKSKVYEILNESDIFSFACSLKKTKVKFHKKEEFENE